MAISVVPATGSVENGSNGLSLNGLCRVVLSPIVNDNQQSVPTLIVNGREQSVPTLIGNGREQSVPTLIGNGKQQPLQPNPMSMTSIPAVFINANSR